MVEDERPAMEPGEEQYLRWRAELHADPGYQAVYDEVAAESERWLARTSQPGGQVLKRSIMSDAVFQNIDIDLDAIAEFCRKHHIKKLALFGSVLRDDFRPDSDVDVLYTFEPGHSVGYITLGGIEAELSQLLGGRQIDLVPEKYLHRIIRKSVLEQAITLYEG